MAGHRHRCVATIQNDSGALKDLNGLAIGQCSHRQRTLVPTPERTLAMKRSAFARIFAGLASACITFTELNAVVSLADLTPAADQQLARAAPAVTPFAAPAQP